MSLCVGIIAEDISDVHVLEEIISKMTRRNQFKIRKFLGFGCGKIINKCRDWARNLKIQGCKVLILVHDLDEKNVTTLHLELEQSLKPCPIPQYVIVIPVKEIEAWLLADHHAINLVFKLSLGKIANPQAINRPKEYLRDLVDRRSNHSKTYLNTVHNRKIAAAANLRNLERCTSFLPLKEFIQRVF